MMAMPAPGRLPRMFSANLLRLTSTDDEHLWQLCTHRPNSRRNGTTDRGPVETQWHDSDFARLLRERHMSGRRAMAGRPSRANWLRMVVIRMALICHEVVGLAGL